MVLEVLVSAPKPSARASFGIFLFDMDEGEDISSLGRQEGAGLAGDQVKQYFKLIGLFRDLGYICSISPGPSWSL